MLTEDRRAQFHDAVAEHRLKVDGARSDRPLLLFGVILMVGGVVGGFVSYNASLAQDDLRDVGSSQILAIAFLAVTGVGAAVYIVTGVARVLRVWLLRQLVEGQARADQIAAALARRD